MEISFSPSELVLMRRLDTPIKVQDYLDTLRINFEKNGETLRSPKEVLRKKEAHCIEAALLAAAILSMHEQKPLIFDLKADSTDYDHVVALYKINGFWGAVSKSNHASLRYRDPIYKNLRELALSYFHEYFDNDTGRKSLISYSRPFDLRAYGEDWKTSENDLWEIGSDLDDSKHYPLLSKIMKKNLRKADSFERKAGRMIEWKE